MRALLVAKPWKGGLADYMLSALREVVAGAVEFIPTYPRTLPERVDYLRDKRGWRRRLVGRINAQRYDAAIFINHMSVFRELENPSRNVLWLLDGPKMEEEDLLPFGRVFLSDPGYASDLPATASYAGELPFAHDPALHRPQSFSGQKRGLCFIANKNAKRDVWLAQLSASGLIPTVYGNYFMQHPLFWKHPLSFRPTVAAQAMGAVYARYLAALNIHARVVREGTNMRTFECAGYGVPQLVERRPGLERFFEPDREILVFSSTEECVAQYKRLTGDVRLAGQLTENARRRVLADHTYKQRVLTMLKGLVT